LDRRLGGPQCRSGRDGEDEMELHYPYRELIAGRPARSLVTTVTELPRLQSNTVTN